MGFEEWISKLQGLFQSQLDANMFAVFH